MYKFILFAILSVLIISCEDSGDLVSSGPLKLIIYNNTEYPVTELYYSRKAPEYGSYGEPLAINGLMEENSSISVCPDEEGDYYFSFVRQNGSGNNNLYVTSDEPLRLGKNDGIITIELLPYNFLYKSEKNDELKCELEQ